MDEGKTGPKSRGNNVYALDEDGRGEGKNDSRTDTVTRSDKAILRPVSETVTRKCNK